MEVYKSFKRKIVKNPEDSLGYMVLKPLINNPQTYYKKGICYTSRGLYNCLQNIRRYVFTGELSSIEILIESSASENGKIVLNEIVLNEKGERDIKNIEDILNILKSKK